MRFIDSSASPMKIVYRKPNLDAISSWTGKTEHHPVLTSVLSTRGENDPMGAGITGLSPLSLEHCCSPSGLANIKDFCRVVHQALLNNHSITVVGDYDADGATSTAVAVKGLRLMGAKTDSVHFFVPNRFTTGYGLSAAVVDQLLAAVPNTQVLITVDNGIASIEGVTYAQAKGLQVLVTDHHCPGDDLPSAEAIINPQLKNDEFPSKSLAGVGVIFYAMAALREYLHHENWFTGSRQKPSLACLLDLVAFGTIADLVPLDYNNRILVQSGLKRMRAGRCSQGLLALFDCCKQDLKFLTCQSISYQVAPKLNAAGRLDDMSVGIRCLLADDWQTAYHYATLLTEYNSERRKIQGQMESQARSAITKVNPQQTKKALCLTHPEWHQGVIGILASRVKEEHYCPVIIFAEDEDSSCLKGSGRSIPGIHLREVLAEIDRLNPGLIIKFGGHAMAAGLSIQKSGLESFERLLIEQIEQFEEALFQPVLRVDCQLSAEQLNMTTALALESFGLWGQSFDEPIFTGMFICRQKDKLGGEHIKCRLSLIDYEQKEQSATVEALWFSPKKAISQQLKPGCKLTAYFKLGVNRFRNRSTLNLMIEHVELIAEPLASEPSSLKSETLKEVNT